MKLNLGCNIWKLPGFINIDIDPALKPDLCLDLFNLDTHFKENSIDFIYAGHVFEHFTYDDSLTIMKKCFKVLQYNSALLLVVPDYTKTKDLDITLAEGIILGHGEHKCLYNKNRIEQYLKICGFKLFCEVTDLNQIPYLVVSNTANPKPDPWQTAYVALKL